MPKRKKEAPIPNAPRFFCDNCGTEVPRDSKTCPNCGRSFSSVRCPYCDYVGEEALFINGCPRCGYSTGAASGNDAAGKKGSSGKRGVKAKKKKNKRDHPEIGLPFWVYIITTAVFTAILAALLFRVF